MPRISQAVPVLAILFLFAASLPASSQSQYPAPRSRILQPVDDSRTTTLSGNTHPLARPEFDQGILADSTPLSRIVLILARSPEQESSLQQLIDSQQDKTSSTYHQWLTPETFGATFGPSDRDLSTVTTWLAGHGFSGIHINPARTFIEFSGTAGSVRAAFRTSMHRYAVPGQIQGAQHFANASDPAIPSALAPIIAGIASLNNFPRRASSHRAGIFHHDPVTHRTTRLANQTQDNPAFTINDGGQPLYGVTPYDFATIYNVLPLWTAGSPIDGTGQTIAIVGQTDINPADFVNFRKLFNLPLGNTSTPTGTQYLNIIYNGPNPGITRDEGEADIDTQWSGAVAKGATIDYVVSQGTEVTQGTDLSALYIVDNNLAPVMSYSYGQCELFLGTSGNTFYKTLWQQAAAQGITVLLASGDSGSAGCDIAGVTTAAGGLAVNGLASTPYNIAVGGTDFFMPYGGTPYWNPINDPATQASARGYIPEVPWNESCTNSVFPIFSNFGGETPEQVCNNSLATIEGLISVVAAGGGPSSCIQSNGSSASSCRGGYPKPSWQTGAGVPADGVRDTPDVSLFASSGFFNAFYVVCQQSTNSDGNPCNLAAPAYDFAGYGGTSVSSPAFAGILALVNQKTGSRQGNANYVLYNLAAQQTKASAQCNAAAAPAAGCIFNDLTTSTIAMPCLKGALNCSTTTPSDRYGVLSGYSAAPGYDLATGLGSVNAANLVNNWSSASFTASTTSLTLSPSTITHGTPVSAAVRVASAGGTPTGSVSINALAANGSVQNGTLSNGSYTASLSSFPGGTYSVQAHYPGDGLYAPSDSNPVTLTVSPESSATTLRALLYNPANGSTFNLATAGTYPYGGVFLLRADVAGLSGQGTATGNILLTDSGSAGAGSYVDGGIFRLNSTANTEDQAHALTPGTHILTAAYSGDASFNTSTSASFTLNIVKATTASSLQVDLPVLSAARTLTLTAKVAALGFGTNNLQGFGAAAPTGLVTFSSGSLNVGSATLTPATYPASPTDSGSVAITVRASLLPIGADAVTVTYQGDANYASSTSPPLTVIVTNSTQVATITTLSSPGTNAAPGTPPTFSAQVAPTSPLPGSPLPTGTIDFVVDSKSVGAVVPLSSGTATISSGSLPVPSGVHTINAIYSGDANYQASLSNAAPVTILSATAASTATVALTPSAVAPGATVTVAVSLTPVSPPPTGTLQLILDGSLFGSPVRVTAATTGIPLLTSTLQSGTHVLRVFYSGDANYRGSTSSNANLTILGSVGTFTLSPSTSSATAALGHASGTVTLTATPTGGFHSTITFACTGGLPSGAACLFTPSSIALSDPTPASTTLTISPNATGTQLAQPAVQSAVQSTRLTAPVSRNPPSGKSSQTTSLAGGFSMMLAGLFFFVLPRRIRLRWTIVPVLFAIATLGLLSGCGSGGVDPGGLTPGHLSAGSYTVTVTATGGSTIQTATINLTIQ